MFEKFTKYALKREIIKLYSHKVYLHNLWTYRHKFL